MVSQDHVFVILKDGASANDGPMFFSGLQNGYLWSETFRADAALWFTSRDDAARTLHQFSKHTDGWRILRSDQI